MCYLFAGLICVGYYVVWALVFNYIFVKVDKTGILNTIITFQHFGQLDSVSHSESNRSTCIVRGLYLLLNVNMLFYKKIKNAREVGTLFSCFHIQNSHNNRV